MPRLRPWIHLAIWPSLAGLAGVLGCAAWVIEPYPLAPTVPLRTASELLRAPFAERIVIGDSRVEWAVPVGDSLFMGYGGANYRHLERLTRKVCAISGAPLTVALGINDSNIEQLDPAASLASLDAIIAACDPRRLRIALAWPADQAVGPYGATFRRDALTALNRAILARSRAHGFAVLPAPRLAGHTYDGVHFDAVTSVQYMAALDTRF